jgi:hypothetical protein
MQGHGSPRCARDESGVMTIRLGQHGNADLLQDLAARQGWWPDELLAPPGGRKAILPRRRKKTVTK